MQLLCAKHWIKITVFIVFFFMYTTGSSLCVQTRYRASWKYHFIIVLYFFYVAQPNPQSAQCWFRSTFLSAHPQVRDWSQISIVARSPLARSKSIRSSGGIGTEGWSLGQRPALMSLSVRPWPSFPSRAKVQLCLESIWQLRSAEALVELRCLVKHWRAVTWQVVTMCT